MVELLLQKIKSCDSLTIAIDGPSGSGKTTLADKIAKTVGCSIIRTDDFFLRAGQEMPVPYVNLDVIRLENLVKNTLNFQNRIRYSKYDCGTGNLIPAVHISQKVTIIEGCCSASPNLLKYYDFFVFLDIDRNLQLERIKARSPCKYENFVTQWIPNEDIYFQKYRIRETAKKEPNYYFQVV